MTGELSLRAAAGELNVHYMTAYRYVRNGRLPARKVGGEWRVRPDDLRRLVVTSHSRPDVSHPDAQRPASRRSRDPARLAARLVVSDEAGAWGVVEQAMTSGAAPADVLLELVAPALVDIGDRWERGELTVAEEHRASAVATRLIGRLGPRFARRGRKRGTVVVGCAPGDRHALPAAMLGDLLRAGGYDVIDLGADPSTESFLDVVRDTDGLVGIAVSVTWSEALVTLPSTLAAIKVAAPLVPIVVGGRAVREAAHATDLGADLWAADGPGAVELFDSLTSSRPARAS